MCPMHSGFKRYTLKVCIDWMMIDEDEQGEQKEKEAEKEEIMDKEKEKTGEIPARLQGCRAEEKNLFILLSSCSSLSLFVLPSPQVSDGKNPPGP